jgi:2-haloacid dehalogenase
MTEANRRQFLGTATAAFAQPRSTVINAVAFDALAIFDPRPVFHLAEELFPGRGAELSNQWRTRQFEYTWLRNSMHRYVDFWHVTQDALNYAANQSQVKLNPEQSLKLMSAYLKLKPWPDVAAVIETLRKRGLRLALLSNFTPAMLQACVKSSALEAAFEFQLSTDRVKAFKPDPAAYQMGLDAFHLEKQEIAFVAFGAWDAVGAKAFGYPTYWVNRLDSPPEELSVSAGKTYHDLSFLPTFLDSLRI